MDSSNASAQKEKEKEEEEEKDEEGGGIKFASNCSPCRSRPKGNPYII